MKKCKICSKKVRGRSDKKFCSVLCKNKYHHKLRNYTLKYTKVIDEILHRNYAILTELVTTSKSKIKMERIHLEKKNFQFNYHTHTLKNKEGKTYYYLYNIAWMSFSDNQILIVRTR